MSLNIKVRVTIWYPILYISSVRYDMIWYKFFKSHGLCQRRRRKRHDVFFCMRMTKERCGRNERKLTLQSRKRWETSKNSRGTHNNTNLSSFRSHITCLHIFMFTYITLNSALSMSKATWSTWKNSSRSKVISHNILCHLCFCSRRKGYRIDRVLVNMEPVNCRSEMKKWNLSLQA